MQRLTWLDLARGVAVIGMLIAHTNPVGGVLNLTEYVTAPLFVLLIGFSLQLAWNASTIPAGRFLLRQGVRGAMLIVAGVGLQQVYWPIDVVLPTLGLLLVVLTPIIIGCRGRAWALLAGAALFFVISPPLMNAARSVPGVGEPWLGWLAGGVHYRVTSFLIFALVGAALAGWASGPAFRGPRSLLVSAGSAAIGGALYFIGKGTQAGAAPYSGTWWELAGALCLATAVAFGMAWLVDALGEARTQTWLAPLIATGRMAFSAYVVQTLVLAWFARTVLLGQSDDQWWVMITLPLICLAFCWVWLQRWTQGPLEWLLRLPNRL